ncbi:MAG: AAA family ATPase, partial [Solirubrobacterales bacterium]|nr:AAA family ATPase [Solirubrobacterales bacterium]
MGVAVSLGFLGPFELRVDGGAAVPLGGRRQRALLLVLALHANQAVATDRLIDELWGENPPATAQHTVQVFVSRLRGALGDAGKRLLTRAPGYLLEIGPDEIDADRCARLYATARGALAAGEPARASALLSEAQTLWRGPPLADFTYEPFAQATIARLEELRISCREELIEAELASGHHAEILLDLEALVREHPLRERPRGQLMLALYRCGRQAEALDAYQQARRMLVEELAVEPGAALRELEQAILRQDESLLAPTPPAEMELPLDVAEPALAGASAAQDADQPDAPAPPSAEPSAAAVVRKVVTVLVGRIAGQRARGQVDPEAGRRVLAAARERAQEIVTAHGGTFVPALGGEIVGVFGLPLTREDDVLRALRAADEIRANLVGPGSEEPGELAASVGLDTGEVIAEGPNNLFGDPLTGAITLARSAQDGEVLMSEGTHRVASAAVRVEGVHAGSAWRLLGLIADAPMRRRETGTAMVDRQDEMAIARSAFARAVRAGEPHLLTVVGEPGIGKSRLCEELVDQLADEATVLTGRCLSYGEGIAFWPLREALTEAAGGESRDAVRGLLAGAEDAELVADIVSATLGLKAPQGFDEQVPWAFRRLLEVLARDRALILVIDDVHWAEPLLLDLVDYLIDWLTAPALVVCLARPELLEVRPSWGGGHSRVNSIVIDPLKDEDAQQLLQHQQGERSLSAAESARIIETAEGNPLFVEQLLAMSAEDPRWTREGEIPPTIQSLLAARLDRLGPGERAVIERAAVIGREFWQSAVVDLLPGEARRSAAGHLRALVHRGLLHPDRSTMAGEEALRFHHILIQEVAYRGTPKTLRGELHERFADWIERRGDGYEEFIGYHLEQAFRYRNEIEDSGAAVHALGIRAGEALAVAGRRAIARGDTNAGVKFLRRSTELFEASGSARPDVVLDLGSALSDSGDFS